MLAALTRRYRLVVRVALAAYTVLLAYILGWPSPTEPVLGSLRVISIGVRDAGASDGPGGLSIEFIANIALFVPFGLLLALALRPGRGWWLAALAGLALSVAAETFQATVLPGRSGTLADVLANTAGALAGAALAALALRRSRRPDAHPRATAR